MDTSNWTFVTIYVDHDVDLALRVQAAAEAVSKGEMCRRYVTAGIARVDGGVGLRRLHDDDRLSLRTVYLPPDLNGRVSALGVTFHLKRVEIVRQLLRLGMETLRQPHCA